MALLNVDITEQSSGVFTVKLNGSLDTETYHHFEHSVEKFLTFSTRAIVLDMLNVNYISSMGIGSLFKCRKIAQERDFDIRMVNLQPQIKKVLDTVQAMPPEAIFSSIEELDEYVHALQAQALEDEQKEE